MYLAEDRGLREELRDDAGAAEARRGVERRPALAVRLRAGPAEAVRREGRERRRVACAVCTPRRGGGGSGLSYLPTRTSSFLSPLQFLATF